MGDSGKIDSQAAAEIIGITTASLFAWCRTGVMRHKRSGRGYFFEIADCELVRDLREEHGSRKWVNHVPWDTSGESQAEESNEPAEPTLAERLIAKAKAAKEKGEYLMAYEMLETVVDSFNWGEV